jgi:hypothetical protein
VRKRANAELVEAYAKLCPESGARWIEVAGAYAMYDGVNSPCTQTFGLGFLADLGGRPIAQGALKIGEGVALLAGASTIPEARKQGAQLALRESRLRAGAAEGCAMP